MSVSGINTRLVESAADSIKLDTGKDASYRIRELIFEASKAENNISLVYKDTLRSIRDLFSGFKVVDFEDKVRTVKCIHANQERSIAKMIQEDNLILPIISVAQPTTALNTDRQKYFPMIVSESIWDDRAQRAKRVVSLAPRPVDISYKITILSKYKSDLDQITEQIYLLFNPTYELQTSFANNTKAFLEQEDDESSVDVGDREDRILLRSFTIKVETYIPTPKFLITSTGKIERFYNEITVVKEIK